MGFRRHLEKYQLESKIVLLSMKISFEINQPIKTAIEQPIKSVLGVFLDTSQAFANVRHYGLLDEQNQLLYLYYVQNEKYPLPLQFSSGVLCAYHLLRRLQS